MTIWNVRALFNLFIVFLSKSTDISILSIMFFIFVLHRVTAKKPYVEMKVEDNQCFIEL